MHETKYVTVGAAALAREIERKFQELPKEAGVICVGVKALPAANGEVDTYHVQLGISKSLGEDVGWALIQKVKHDMPVLTLMRLTGTVFLVYSGECSDKGPKDVGPASAKANDPV